MSTQVRGPGNYFYLYLFVDLFSRKIVGWQVYDCESAELASSALLQDICARQGIVAEQLVVHSDNGAPMKGETMQRLGVAPSRSRPSVSNDNPYSESLFRTLKYRPAMPVKPFENLIQARRWVSDLVHWYNDEHRHSAIRFVTPSQRHAQHDKDLLAGRAKLAPFEAINSFAMRRLPIVCGRLQRYVLLTGDRHKLNCGRCWRLDAKGHDGF